MFCFTAAMFMVNKVLCEITVFELAMVDYPRFAVGKQHTIVFQLKRLGVFYCASVLMHVRYFWGPQETNMHQNRSAIQGLIPDVHSASNA